jgi:hypothetical protein
LALMLIISCFIKNFSFSFNKKSDQKYYFSNR